MTEKTPALDDALPDAEAEARFKRLVGNLVNTPHKPHKPRVAAAPEDGNARTRGK